MYTGTFALLALSAIALAHPKRHHHYPTGTGTGRFIRPTGGPFSTHNSTDGHGFGAGSSSVADAATTLTVVPLPANSTSVAATSSVLAAADVVNQSSVDTAVDAAATSTSCTSSSTVTSTVTSVQYFSVTVTGGAESLSLSTSASVAAGDFFQQSSSSGGFSSAASATSSAASSISTTFATSMLTSAASGQSITSSSAAASTSTTASSNSTSGKKGLSYNDAALTDVFAGDGMTWAYNWADSQGGTLVSGVEYVPMLWGESSVSGWSSAAQTAISSGSSHLLSFNEPDLSSQSDLTPSNAASLHITNMNPFADQAQIGSPAITNGAGSSPAMGTTWLQEFFTACNGECKVDFVAFHWYNDASEIEDFKSHVNDVISTASTNGVSKVWLTEFGATGSDSDIASFLSEAISFLDSESAVERYAYFMCGDGTLLSGDSLSTIGEAYIA